MSLDIDDTTRWGSTTSWLRVYRKRIYQITGSSYQVIWLFHFFKNLVNFSFIADAELVQRTIIVNITDIIHPPLSNEIKALIEKAGLVEEVKSLTSGIVERLSEHVKMENNDLYEFQQNFRFSQFEGRSTTDATGSRSKRFHALVIGGGALAVGLWVS